ncbi:MULTISPECIES: bifunctional phosphopantothenoylcysteine decarboxylase/phosphopantothenate--cysteine ligase CoaBC [unclassified Helicobacter]|uniref:bifunctional phosphopantothenoylcysteine decarboxylase/phosphopantothenate--cysteine ligase CoaBC n=1 Tax=unclassified Helicobacter TaxID=2593540 RepID=UPI000CF06D6D|nr:MULTISPECIES: bifunctional phosphopantothenoylcysteine decarboxylase/phosphopantothenate--cysteine ligase CoaBC [unclassified Helicobacter]
MIFTNPLLLKDKKILIGVSSSIAIYKILDLISMLKKLGADIRVVMTEEAKKFVTPLCFEALTHTKVLHLQSEDWSNGCNHIDYAKWADVFLIAPTTANTLAKISYGIADNLLLSTLLASKAPKLIAPAMNTQMLENPKTQENISKLRKDGFKIIATRSCLLACDTFGDGALATPKEIVFNLIREFYSHSFYKNKRVMITGGGSKENIDLVRCISNHSSGLQASALALAFYFLGANVTFISSIFPQELPNSIQQIKVASAKEYLEAIKTNLTEEKTYLIMSAAIADFIPKNSYNTKIKKQDQKNLTLELERNIDILESLNQKNLVKIGFKAELDKNNAIDCAKKMLETKNCACVCLNILSNHNTFGSQNNEMILFSKDKQKQIPLSSKLQVAFEIADFLTLL